MNNVEHMFCAQSGVRCTYDDGTIVIGSIVALKAEGFANDLVFLGQKSFDEYYKKHPADKP